MLPGRALLAALLAALPLVVACADEAPAADGAPLGPGWTMRFRHPQDEGAMLEALRALDLGIELGDSHTGLLPNDAELVVRSAAVSPEDPQVLRARELGIPVLKYADVLPKLAPARRTLAVAGTHGKTTTSWMLWHALEGVEEKLRGPVAGALIGGICRRLRTNALAGSTGGWFCVEACEYDRSFLKLSPQAAVITNVEEDHLDYYGTLDAIHGAFARFADRVAGDGLLVLGRQVPESIELGARANVWRLGREFDVDLLGEDRGAFRFRLRGPGWATRPVALAVPGHFNVENAALVLALAVGITERASGLEPAVIANAACNGLERFLGVHRRFDPWGSVEGIDVVHDYAHHPSAVRVTIEAGLRAFPGAPLHVLFQPHQHSRTSHFLAEFAESLRAADRVVVSDVYGARLHIDGEKYAGAPELVLELKKRGVDAVEGGPVGSSVERLVAGLPDEGTVFVLGAGDIELCRDALFHHLALRSPVAGRSRS